MPIFDLKWAGYRCLCIHIAETLVNLDKCLERTSVHLLPSAQQTGKICNKRIFSLTQNLEVTVLAFFHVSTVTSKKTGC